MLNAVIKSYQDKLRANPDSLTGSAARDVSMPVFQGQVSEEQLLALVEYVKSLQTVKTLKTGS